MPSTDQDSILDTSVLSTKLFAVQELVPRARLVAHLMADLIPLSAVTVYTLESNNSESCWIPRATVGEATIHEGSIRTGTGVLDSLLDEPTPRFRVTSQPKREDYPHVDARRTVRSLCYLPLLHNDAIFGAVEILSFQGELSDTVISGLLPATRVAAAALASAQTYESERNSNLSAITRLTQLYDLEKVFSSTLEMAELLPIIGGKFSEILECQGVNIWLLHQDETLELMEESGRDPTSYKGQVVKPGEGIAGALSDTGESVCISDPLDVRLVQRNARAGQDPVRSLIAVAIMDRESLVGVVEAVNKLDGSAFDDDDLFILASLTDTASNALHNASLLMAERKVEILETLNNVSHEITSTLNLDRMLQTIVNAPQAVVPYERAAIALEQRGRFKLSAVSGLTQLNADAPDIAPLNDVLQWASLSAEIVHVRQHGEEIDADREETRAKFRKYFADSGMRGFYAMPLNDDTGRVGMLALEAADPDFLAPAHIEILQLLASQATVALRNAQMYKEVPFISVIEPVLVRKRQFMAMEKRRRTLLLAICAASILFLVVFPFPLRVDGDAVVNPLHRVQVQPETEGVISRVFVHEGQPVHAGQVLAEMENWDAHSHLAETQSRYESALMQMNHALAANDGSEAGARRVQADYWKAEVGRAQGLLDKTELRSPIEGIVSTPRVDSFAGRKLMPGDFFAEIVDTSRAIIDVGIEEEDAGLLKEGQNASIKLNSYPARTFHGQVVVISQKADGVHETPVFYSRVAVDNPDGAMRSGMEGRGKVRVGTYPAGYVFLRHPVIWLSSKLWSWLGW